MLFFSQNTVRFFRHLPPFGQHEKPFSYQKINVWRFRKGIRDVVFPQAKTIKVGRISAFVGSVITTLYCLPATTSTERPGTSHPSAMTDKTSVEGIAIW